MSHINKVHAWQATPDGDGWPPKTTVCNGVSLQWMLEKFTFEQAFRPVGLPVNCLGCARRLSQDYDRIGEMFADEPKLREKAQKHFAESVRGCVLKPLKERG